jgi:hypothetical protein
MDDIEVLNRLPAPQRIMAMQQYTQIAVNLRAVPSALHDAATRLLCNYALRRMRQDGFSGGMLMMRTQPPDYLVAIAGRHASPWSTHLKASVMRFARSELRLADTGYRHAVALHPATLATDSHLWGGLTFEAVDMGDRPDTNSIEASLGAMDLAFLLEALAHLRNTASSHTPRTVAMEADAHERCRARVEHVALLSAFAAPDAEVDVNRLVLMLAAHRRTVGLSRPAHLSDAAEALVCDVAEEWAEASVHLFGPSVTVDDLARALQSGVLAPHEGVVTDLVSLGELIVEGASGTLYQSTVEALVTRFSLEKAGALAAYARAAQCTSGRELGSFLRHLATACESCRLNFETSEYRGLGTMLQAAAQSSTEIVQALKHTLQRMTHAGESPLVVPTVAGGSIQLPAFVASAQQVVVSHAIRHACSDTSAVTLRIGSEHAAAKAFRRRVLFLVDETLVAYHDSLAEHTRGGMAHFFAEMSAVEAEKACDLLNDLFDLLEEPPVDTAQSPPVASEQEVATRDAAAVVMFNPTVVASTGLVDGKTLAAFQLLVSRIPGMHGCVMRPSESTPLPIPTPALFKVTGLKGTVKVAFAAADRIAQMACQNHRSGGIRPSDVLEISVNRDLKPYLHDLESVKAAQTQLDRAASIVIRQLGNFIAHPVHGARGGASVSTNDTKHGTLSHNPKRVITIRSIDAINRVLLLLALYIADELRVKVPQFRDAQTALFSRAAKRKKPPAPAPS